MLYTLLKFLGWGALLAVIGGCIGWMLRALKCRGEVAAARTTTVDEDEVERMRHRLANLEQVVAERDRLRMQVADMRHADSPGVVGLIGEFPVDPVGTDDATNLDANMPVEQEVATDDSQPDGSVDDVGAPEESGDASEGNAGESVSIAPDADAPDLSDAPAAPLDLVAAAATIGKKIKLDDLTAVEGIGPKIAELCSGIGVTTWQQLAATDVAELQSMLDAAGSRYAVHKPGSWPQQAALLASGLWTEFKTLTDEFNGGR